VDITEGANFTDVTDLLLGTFTILDPAWPDPPMRRVKLPAVSGVEINPPGNIVHSVPSGSDFTFTLRLSDALAGQKPEVTTGRTTDNEGGVACTLNADGSFTVVIRSIRQDLEVSVALVPSGSAGTSDTPRAGIWAAGNRIYLSAVRSGRAHIYTPAGLLVKTVAVIAGQTVSDALPAGFYIVALDGERWKIAVSD
jgi:hypothetical protein